MARFRREAEALAALSHPNVVNVFDVGTDGEQLHITMELVVGPDLVQWARAEGRRHEEIVAAAAQIARGLAAIHSAGLVHRDVKPSNILVDADSRPRIADFGLAVLSRPLHERLVTQGDHELGDIAGGALGGPITRSGVLLGTPSYMAPEQHVDTAADPRADQFAFFVSLFEALCGARPFRERAFEALYLAKVRGPVWPDARPLPAELRAVISRGLSPDRDRRFGDMLEVAAALEAVAVPRRRPHRLVAAALAMATPLLLIGAAVSANHGAAVRPSSAATASAPELAPEHRGHASEVAFHLRRSVDLLSASQPAQALRALELASAASAQIPGDPFAQEIAARQVIAALVSSPGAAQIAAVESVAWQLIATRRDALAAEAVLTLAHAYVSANTTARPEDARPWLRAAEALCERVQDPRLRLRAELARGHLSVALGDAAAGLQHAEQAIVYADARVPDTLRSDAIRLRGTALFELGRLDDALRSFESAQSIDDRRLGPAHPGHAETLAHLANVWLARRAPGRAKPLLQRALRLFASAWGEQSVAVAKVRDALGNAAMLEHDWEEAAQLFAQAEAGLVAHLGHDHPRAAAAASNLAYAEARLGRHDAARRRLARAIAVLEAGASDRDVLALARTRLGHVLLRAADLRGARREFEAARAIFDELPVTETSISAIDGLARLAETQGDWEQAVALRERIAQRRDSGPARARVVSLLNLANALAQAGRADRARHRALEALALLGTDAQQPGAAQLRGFADRILARL